MIDDFFVDHNDKLGQVLPGQGELAVRSIIGGRLFVCISKGESIPDTCDLSELRQRSDESYIFAERRDRIRQALFYAHIDTLARIL